MKKREEKKLMKLLFSLVIMICIAIAGYYGYDIEGIANKNQTVVSRHTRYIIQLRRYTRV